MHRHLLFATLRSLIVLILLLLLFPTLSCTTMGTPKNDESGLLQSVQAFHAALRWENYQLASSWLPGSQKELFWSQADELQENVRVMDFSVRDLSVEPEGFKGVAYIRCQYFHTRDPRLMNKTLKQRWFYSPQDKTWLVEHTDLDVILARP